MLDTDSALLEMPAAHVSAAASDFHIAPCLTQTLPVSTAADVHVSPAMHQTTVAPTLLYRPYHTSLKYWTLRSLRSASFRRSWMPKSCGHGRQGQRGMERRSLLGGNRVINIFSFVVVDDHSLANRINAAPTSVGVLQSAVGKNFSAEEVGLISRILIESSDLLQERIHDALVLYPPAVALTLPRALIDCRDEYLTLEFTTVLITVLVLRYATCSTMM